METARLMETQHHQPSGSSFSAESDKKKFVLLPVINVRRSSHSALSVCAFGNCCSLLPLKSHHLTRPSPPLSSFIFEGLTRDKHPQVGFNGLTASKVPWKSVDVDMNLFQFLEGAGRMRMGLRKLWWWDSLRSCPDWGLQQGSLSFSQLFPSSKAREERFYEIIQ